MSNPQRPGWPPTPMDDHEIIRLDWSAEANAHMDHLERLIDKQVEKLKGRRQALDELEAENRELRTRLAEAEMIIRCAEVHLSDGANWLNVGLALRELGAFANQKGKA